MSESARWYVNDELTFLIHLGFRKWSRSTRLDRGELLKLYIGSIGLRTEPWVPKVKKAAEKMLKEWEEGM